MAGRDGVMRLRGAVLLAIAVPFWIYLVWFHVTVMNSPYAYEMGSVAGRFPPQVRAATGLSLIFTLSGTLLLVVDVIGWIRNKSVESAKF
jgi:hypothetical protein